MGIPKGARTGLLLFLTAGPFLVFLFLYIFGKNRFELDLYPVTRESFCTYSGGFPSTLLLVDRDFDSSRYSKTDFENEQKRLDEFWKKKGSSPEILPVTRGSGVKPGENLPNGTVKAESEFWLSVDTVLDLQSAKGPIQRRLPPPPRAFLFDKNQNLRGVYGLCNSLSVDTLMLEYTILTNQ